MLLPPTLVTLALESFYGLITLSNIRAKSPGVKIERWTTRKDILWLKYN